ncbi:MAG: hypothetical protein Q7U53_18000 [Anaerolineaceae bacterium]|nr:hypothetical protein [Anaerolineaceae bacterium]
MKKKTDKDNKNLNENEKPEILENDSGSISDQLNKKFSNNIDDRLDEIKKLASDFSMSDESIEENAGEFDNEFIGSDPDGTEDDYLDRLSVLDQEVSPFINEDEKEDFLDQRLDQINKQAANIEPEEFEYLRKSSSVPFAPIPNFEDFEGKKSQELPKKRIDTIEDIENDTELDEAISQNNEDFLNKLTSSLEEDPQYQDLSSNNDESKHVFKTFDEKSDGSELIEEIEHEIDNANKAVNPFLNDHDSLSSDDFLANLNKLTLDEDDLDQTINDIDPLGKMFENESMLSSTSWKDVLESTDDDESGNARKVFDFNNEQSFDEFINNMDGVEEKEKSEFPLLGDGTKENFEEMPVDTNMDDDSFQESDDGQTEEEDESVENLRRSFIDEFDQDAWNEETENQEKKKWLPRNIDTFKNWFSSLSIAERILIFLSFLISLAVVVSIVLVITQWRVNNRNIASPPPAIEASDTDLIYPTGLQLPGGWFFFLQRGEIKNNKWEPQNAEWLSNTKLRKVVAIPWSNQTEAVIQSLTSEDEISIYMNNNDIIIYQVEEVLQISRDNVRILSDTEPSLVVILFREDNENRWSVIAKPK